MLKHHHFGTNRRTLRHFFLQSILISGLSATVYAAEKYNPNENQTIPGDPNDPFANFKITGVNRELMHTTIYGSYDNDRDALTHTSKYSMNLNGRWKFKLYQKPSEVPADFMATGYDDANWGTIAVPSNWQLDESVDDMPYYTRDSYIFDANPPDLPEHNPTGCYRQTLNVPADWLERDVRLTFCGVDSGFQLWINGKYVGYGEDSRLPSEFAVTDYLVNGLNTIAVKVQRFSTGSYLESQDVWHMSGIFRDVRIMARPKVNLRDWSVRTVFDKEYKNATLETTIYLETRAIPRKSVSRGFNSNFNEYKVRIRLADENDRTVSESGLTDFSGNSTMYGGAHTERGAAKISLKVTEPKKWSPEHPNLYRLYIYLTNARGTVQEVQCQKVGFRQIEIRNSQLLFNGKRFIVRGVDRHDFSAYHGFAVTEQEMRADIVQMKKLNFNAVRTSHYPSNERWYELCDELGIAVVDETNIETHGLGAYFTVKPEWATVFLERAQRMVLRDRNHPCVMVWSLGNESGTGANHAVMAAWMRYIDPSRPVQYESNNAGPMLSDILCPMYPRIRDIIRGVQNDSRPFIMCEYAYAKGNATGDFFKYWDLVRSTPSFQGGFIWDWSDKALYGTCIADGKKHLGFGNDFGENFDYRAALAGQHPTQVLNGIVAADLKPHPGAEEVRLYQAPVSFNKLDLQKDDGNCVLRLKVNNEYIDTNLDTLTCKWNVAGNGVIGQSGEIKLPSVQPMESGELILKAAYMKDKESFFNLYIYDDDREITRSQFKITDDNVSATPDDSLKGDASLKVTETDDKLTVGAFTWSKKSGKLISILVDDKEQLYAPVDQIFWRAPTCNDKKLDANGTFANDWIPLFTPKETLNSFHWEKTADGCVTLVVKTKVHCIDTVVTWKVGANNTLSFDQAIDFKYENLHSVARVGMIFPLAKGLYTDVDYYGRGPHENYPDRQHTALVGTYKNTVSGMMENYLITQECGSRGEVRKLEVCGKENMLRVIQNIKPFRFSALPYSPMTLKGTGTQNSWWQHDWQLPAPDGTTWLILDGFHMGLGGDDGWSVNVHPEFELRPKKYQWSATLQFSEQ